ncbi:hypothetical protein TorRG33x02_294550 [Trema orientale]|uniref:Uncharacterized protein n=1 Tax=Trema orientale TaxID=63057 RepID=A0A2P5C814_TREOI|nr:hypothetical protein TorRG33x02_294550 [Trema orientale]
MVSVHGDYGPAGPGGFAAELLDEVEDFKLVVAPVEDVADLNQHGGPSNPFIRPVNQTRQPQRLPGLFEVAMDVSDGDEARGGGVPGLQRSGVVVRVLVR